MKRVFAVAAAALVAAGAFAECPLEGLFKETARRPNAGMPKIECGTAGKSVVPVRFGIAGYTFCKFNLDETLEIMKMVDAHWLCVKDYHLKQECTQEEADQFKEKLAAAGVQAAAVGPVYVDSEKNARRAFEWAKKLGVKTVVGIPLEHQDTGELNEKGKPKRKDVESDAMLDVIEKLVKEYDMNFAIHNHGPDMPDLYPNADAIMKRIASRDKRVGLCLDIGHEFRFGTDPREAIAKYGERIHDIHLKNVSHNDRRGGAMPLPRGAMDLPAIFKALCDAGYKGVLHLEYERDFECNILGIAESIGYYRGIVDTMR